MTTAHPAELHVPRTEQHSPRLPVDLIDRPHLLARLDRAVDVKMALVWAPAGYGKSTLLGSWLAASRLPTAWLSLDVYDTTVSGFVRALVAAIRTVVPNAGKNTLALLNLTQPPSSALLATTLTDELSALSEPPVLVLDNYERVHAAPVHELLSSILLRLPQRLHVVVASRTLPPLPLPTLRAEGQLAEIDVDDLKFGLDETRTFLDRSLQEHLPQKTVTFLAERTEGWPAGLRLAAILLRDRPDRDSVLAALATGSHEYIRDYLLDETLDGQSPVVRRFLLETAILDRFCAPLCSATLGDISLSTSSEMLERLTRDGVMLVGLDERGEWFRYHHLFEELLRRRLHEEVDAAGIAALHRRAAAWLAGDGAVIDAVRHLLAAGDADAAARLVESDIHPALNREDWARVASEIDVLPPVQVRSRAALLLARAWVLHFHGRVLAMAPLLEEAESAFAARPPADDEAAHLRGELDTLWAEVWLRRGDLRATLSCAQRGGEHLTDAQLYARGVADGFLGVALHRRGHGRDALSMYRTRADRETGSTAVYTARLLLIMAYCYLTDGRLDLVENRAWRILALARDHQLPVTETWIRHVLGRVLYEWNDLDRAAEQYIEVVERRDVAHFDAYRDSVFGLALCYQAMGQPGRALSEVHRLLRMMREAGRPRQLDVIRSFEARLALLRGDTETWGRWLDTNRDALMSEPSDALVGLECPPITRAWALIALGDSPSLSQANDELAVLKARYAAENDRSRLVNVFALEALAGYTRGDQASGLAILERALANGRRGDFVRTIVDLGPPMARMVSTLGARERSSVYLRRLQAAFMTSDVRSRHTIPGETRQADAVMQPLTWREMDVLKQLGHRLSNKEIAVALSISPLTVKKHTESIYRKLHVTGRRDAVKRAQSFGLL
jgi:LuxR family transcriptional regulator, maltose regulon positive regulatory protein